VEARNPVRHLESQIQSACVLWFRLQYPQYASHLFAIGNGVPNNARQGAIRKREGAVSGVADLMLMVSTEEHCGLFIEMKTATGRIGTEQKAFGERAILAGYSYAVCRSLEDFMTVIRSYLIGGRG